MTATDAATGLWDISMNPSTSPVPSAERDAILANPGFGGHFTDNMVRAKWTADKGWHDAELVARPFHQGALSAALHHTPRAGASQAGGRPAVIRYETATYDIKNLYRLLCRTRAVNSGPAYGTIAPR